MLAASSLWAGSGFAATYTVTGLGDAVGTCTGTSPNFSCPTLRAAIMAANLTVGVADTIAFSVSGTIGVTSALPPITDTLSMNNSGITLNGGGGSYNAIRFSGAGASGSLLQNYVITNFNQTLVSADSGAANVAITGNTLTGNATTFDAIRCLDSDNCSVTNNTLSGNFAYGISYYNFVSIAGYNGTITGNIINATTINSGIGVGSGSNVIVSNNQLSASNGCGINLYQNFAAGNTNSNTVTNNTLSGGTGTGICLTDAQGAQTNSNTIQGNSITGMGGDGIRLSSSGAGGIASNSITGNTVTGNGGDGVSIIGANAQNNFVAANINISGNGGLGIDLGTSGVTANDAGDTDTGPNGLQNFPVIAGINGNAVSFTLNTTANANGYRIDFYNNTGGLDPTGFGEGQAWLGSCIVTTFSATVPSSCTIAGVSAASLRMTATRCLTAACTSGATSEFNGPATTDLRITKTDGQTIYAPGQTIAYTIVVTNAGTSSVSGAVFTDPAVSGVTVASVTCGSPTAGSACPSAANTTVALMQGAGIVIPTLTPGGSVTFTVNITVAAARTGSLTNTAAIAVPVGVSENAAADNTASDTDGMQPSFGVCDSRLWLEQSPGAPTPTTLYQIGTNANPLTFNAVGTAAVVYNAVGYNPADNYQYGLITPTSNTLVRIGSDGAAVSLGAVSGLPVATYISGAFGTAGNVLYVKSNLAAGTTMYAINVTTMTATPVSLSAAIDIADWAWVNGLLYGVTLTGQLVSVNPSTGAVANIGASNSLPDGYFGAMYGAPNGLYGSGNNPPSGFYKFDLATGTATLISGAPGSSANDGSNCPTANITFGADLQITKTNTPVSGPNDLATDSYTPDTARTYTVVVTNAGPFGAANAVFTDPAIANFTVSSVTCGSPIGGGVCPSVANTTVALMQGSGIVIPSLPYSSNTSSSVTFSVTGSIAAGATGALANLAAVAVGAGTSDVTAANNSATDTDTPTGTIVIVKDAVPNDAQDFAFTTTGTGLSAFSLDDDADGTLSNTRTFTGLEPGSYTVTEAAIAGWSLTGLSCSDPDSGTAADLANRIATIDVDSGETVTCTYTNSKRAVLRLQKALPLGRFVATDQFALQIAGSGAPAPVTTTGTGTTATGTVSLDPAAAGTPYTLSETAAAGTDLNNYTATYACSNALVGGQTPSGSGGSFSLTPVAGDDLTCTLTNTRKPLADLTISKTNTMANGPDDQANDTLTPGAATTYTLVVTNRGPDAVTGAVLRDPSASRVRLSCPGPATCAGAACPSATLTTAQLDAGVALGAMALNDTVTVALACTVQ
ncbi:beta strand repeat-containing protein [Lysobacter sp. Hz 25]|uniref:beta strand repeat-containing protein n=1 Tax=Lysobacter sp. Hz 25 TaxID=3383698 RepID=UPI0038D4446B